KYPIAARLLLFAAPFTLLIVGSATAFLLSGLEQRYAGVSGLAAMLFVAAIFNTRLGHFATLTKRTEGRGAVAALESQRHHEPVYVAATGIATWTFYSTDWRRPDTTYLDSIARLASSGGVA